MSNADFALLPQHVPSNTVGYRGWMCALALLAAWAAEQSGLGVCLLVILALNRLQALNRKFLFAESNPVKAAFFWSYFGVPEAAI